MQGHLESGRLWESHIVMIFKSPKLSFKNTVHDKCIFQRTFRSNLSFYLSTLSSKIGRMLATSLCNISLESSVLLMISQSQPAGSYVRVTLAPSWDTICDLTYFVNSSIFCVSMSCIFYCITCFQFYISICDTYLKVTYGLPFFPFSSDQSIL